MMQSQDRWQGAERDQPATAGPQRTPGIIYAPQRQPPAQTDTQKLIDREQLRGDRLRNQKAEQDLQPAEAGVPGDISKHGEEYLQTVPASMRGIVKGLADGAQGMPSSFALAKPYWQQVLNATYQYDPTFDSSTQPARVAARKAFTGNGKAAQVISSLNRLATHLNSLWENHRALYGPNLGPASGLVAGAIQSFDPKHVKAYNTDLEAIQGEFQKLTKNGVGNEGEAKRLIDNLQAAQSNVGRAAAIQAIVKLAQGQVDPVQQQWESAFPDRPMPMGLTPGSQGVFETILADHEPLPVDKHGTPYIPGASGSAPSSGTPPVDPITGSPTRRMAPNEDLHFNDEAAAPRGARLPPEQEAQVLTAARSGDVGQTIALMEKFTGIPSNPEHRATVEAALAHYRKYPQGGLSIGYAPGDKAAQDQYDREKYGDHLQPAIEGRQNNAAPSAGRGLISGLTLGAAPYIGAAGNSLLTGKPFEDQLQQARALDEADYRVNPVSRTVGEVGGGALAFPAAEAGLARAGARIPGTLGAIARSPVTADALAGGTNSYLGAQDNPGAQGVAGAFMGAGGGVLGRTLGRGIAPTGGASKALYEAGVFPTPGQRLGGVADVAEQGLETIPVLGGMVRGARQQARTQFERGAFNDSLKEIGHQLPADTELGTTAHAFAQNKFSQAYSNARAGMSAKLDDEFNQARADLTQHIDAGGIPEDSAKRFKAIINNAVDSRLQGSDTLSGEAYKDAASKIDKQIRSLRNQPTSDQELAGALEEFSGLLDQAARRSSPPEAVKALDDADAGYAKLVRIESASKSAENPGRFTPKQYANAVMKESGGRAARSKAFLRGDALGQDYATAGLRLGEPPSSGTAAALKKGATTGLLGAAGGYVSPTIPITAALATLPYAPVVREATNRILAPRQGQFAQLLAKIGANTTTGLGAAYADRPTKGRKSKTTLIPVK